MQCNHKYATAFSISRSISPIHTLLHASNSSQLDVEKRLIVVEPGVTMDMLCKATLKHGLVAPVVTEFPGLCMPNSLSLQTPLRHMEQVSLLVAPSWAVRWKARHSSSGQCLKFCAQLRFQSLHPPKIRSISSFKYEYTFIAILPTLWWRSRWCCTTGK